jgi:hypothetical protein
MLEGIVYLFEQTRHSNIVSIEQFGNGHIHDTYQVITGDAIYLLQRINTSVFKSPEPMMEQMVKVTHHLQHFYENNHLPYSSLKVQLSKDQLPYVSNSQGVWRMFDFVEGTFSKENISGKQEVTEAAHVFSGFIEGLLDLPLEGAFYSIDRFHDLGSRYDQLMDAAERSSIGSEGVSREMEQCQSIFSQLQPIWNEITSEAIPKRWVHNDTKINNLLFDKGNHPVCVVDLDTVMPGNVLFDVGDVLRTSCSNLVEDDPNLNQMKLDRGKMDQFVDDFVNRSSLWITEAEVKSMHHAGALMSALMGIRFLTDHLNGNVYYKVKYPDHNLTRARNQLHLTSLFLDQM